MISLSVFRGVRVVDAPRTRNSETDLRERRGAQATARHRAEPWCSWGIANPDVPGVCPANGCVPRNRSSTYTPLVYISPLDPNSTPRERFCTPRTRPHAALTPETWDTPPFSAQGLTTAPRERPAVRRSLHVVSWWCRAARLLATVPSIEPVVVVPRSIGTVPSSILFITPATV